MLLIIPKDAVFAEILIFSNIFNFPTLNCASIWTETVNFNYMPFEPNLIFYRIFQTLFFLLETTSGQSFSKIMVKGSKIPQKGLFHGC